MPAQSEQQSYFVTLSEQRVVVTFEGDWTITEGGVRTLDTEIETWMKRQTGEIGRIKGIVVRSGTGLKNWDSTILVPVLSLKRLADRLGVSWIDADLDPGVRGLLGLATAVPEVEVSERQDPGILERIGNAAIQLRNDADKWIHFVGECVLGLIDLLRGRARMQPKDFFHALQRVGPDAIPIVTLISFLVGLIVAFLGAVVLVKFAAAPYVSYLVGYGMLREMGALMVGITMAGRTGAAFAAEIASMKVNEEIRALETMGINPIVYIVFPRMLALFLTMPLLTLVANLVGVLGGMLVSSTFLDLSPAIFIRGFKEAVSLSDLYLGLFKGTVFGVIVAAAGCLRGLQSGDSADAVGRAATSAVVTSITLIIASNALIDYVAAVLGI